MSRAARGTALAIVAMGLASSACACATSPRPAPAAPYRWTHDARLAVVACREKGATIPTDPAVRLEECRSGNVAACLAVAEAAHVSEPDAAIARAELGRQCASDRATAQRFPKDEGMRRDRVCSCSAWGMALTYDAKARFDREGLAAIDEGCVGGNYDACDDALLLASLCSVEDPRRKRPLCEILRAQGRVPKPDPEPPKLVARALPAELTGCFVAVPGTGGGAVSGAPPAIHCFEATRRLWRLPSGEWDGESTRWSGYPGDPVVYGAAHGGGPDGVTDSKAVALRATSGGALLDEGDDGGPRRLARADGTAHDDARRVPRIEDVCARALQCIRDVAALLPQPEENDAPPPSAPVTLRGCREAARTAAASVRSAPASCARY